MTRVLTVGDGNFSFSLALLLRQRKIDLENVQSQQDEPYSDESHAEQRQIGVDKTERPNKRCKKSAGLSTFSLTATSFDSEQELLEKYPETKQILQKISTGFPEYSPTVLHRVNAVALRETLGQSRKRRREEYQSQTPVHGTPRVSTTYTETPLVPTSQTFTPPPPAPLAEERNEGNSNCTGDTDSLQQVKEEEGEESVFDKIIFNHPHVGLESVLIHQVLLAHFFYSAKEILALNGEIEVSLARDQPERWKIVEQAEKAGFISLGSEIFEEEMFPGYERKRHQTGKSFHRVLLHGNKLTQESMVYRFGLSKRQKDSISPSERKELAEEKESLNEREEKIAKVSKKAEMFQCSQCEKSFRTEQGLKTHTHMVHVLQKTSALKEGQSKGQEESLHCSLCSRDFSNAEGLFQHQRAKHGQHRDIKPDWFESDKGRKESAPSSSSSSTIRCKICQLDFSSAEEMERIHLSLLPSTEISPHVCEKCGKKFSEIRAKRQHENFCKTTKEDL